MKIMNPDRPFVIAGPCSAENEEQVIATAIGLKEIGIQVFRAGLWKPRTKPGSFEGVGNAGLQWLSRVKRETGYSLVWRLLTLLMLKHLLKLALI
jgi:chorismate mutase